ncbi:MAG: GtrA family protein [Pseudomonadota bacterium]
MTPTSLVGSTFARHVAVGLVATLTNYATLMGLLWMFAKPHIFWSALVANLTGIVVAFAGNYLWVHQSSRTLSTSLVLFIAAYTMVALAGSAALAGFYRYVLANVTIGFLIVTAITAIITYYINRKLVFSVRPQVQQEIDATFPQP